VTLTALNKTKRGFMQAGSVLVAVGGGKGGVGKSFISSNLGIFLANMGFNTVLVDLDLGAPNLHTALGEPPTTKNFHEYINGKYESIVEATVSTRFPNLRFLSGANDHSELANISILEQSRLMSALYRIKADFTILDLSAGTHTSTLDFFLMAHRHIVALTPEPTSIENAYRFMKACFYRRLKRYERQLKLEDTIASLMMDSEKLKIKIPADLLQAIAVAKPQQGLQIQEVMQNLRFDILLNQTRSSADVQIGHSIESICRKYFGIPAHLLGHISHDNAVWHALRKRRPLLLESPNSTIYSQILGITRDLASPHLKKAVI
jgi:flagellar biosynthesis protein FlhG